MKNKNAFTLIELLIVVAIIAILAAIAVPNFLEAQVRSKVSRGKADMRTMATALEAYAVDHNKYPNCNPCGLATSNYTGLSTAQCGNATFENRILERLSSPVAYISNSVVRDPFSIRARASAANAAALVTSITPVVAGDTVAQLNSYIYQSWNSQQRYSLPPDGFSSGSLDKTARMWLLHSAGPDSTYHNLGGVLDNDVTITGPILLIYDPTNGTVSFGSIYRVGGMASSSGGTGSYGAGTGLVAAIQTQK